MTRPLWRQRLVAIAPSLSGLYFGCPIYLVGGALHDEDPRDVDVVAVVPDQLFLASYSELDAWANEQQIARSIDAWSLEYDNRLNTPKSKTWERWALDCAKHNARLTIALHKRVDFKVQPETVAAQIDHPRELLAKVKP